jgi:Flp pilus assembly protein TadG
MAAETGKPAQANRKGTALARLKSFLKDRSGNVAVMFALAVIPVISAGGAAVDVSRAMYVKSRLQGALDAAALAVGGQAHLPPADQRALAQRYFDANYPAGEIGVPGTLNVTLGERTIDMSATASVPTTMMRVVGINTMTVDAEVEVTKEMKGLELVLVLDNTGSMASSGKMTALKNSATDLLQILYNGQPSHERVKIGVVPFDQTVRLPDPGSATTRSWIDQTGASSVARLNFDNNRYAWDIYPASPRLAHQLHQSQNWRGCVEARPGGIEYTDTPPTPGQPDTFWVPYFQADEPDNNSSMHANFSNNYTGDGVANTVAWQDRFRRSAKYAGLNNSGPHRGCEVQPILDLTTTRGQIQSTINGMDPNAWTHIAIGLGWGWRVLSPGQPFTRGGPFNDPDWIKAIVLMTDGVNTIPTTGTPLGSNYTAYGYLSQARLGSSNFGTAINNMNADTATMCQRIKDAGIRMYTVLLMENDATVRNLMRNCASGTSRFFDSPTTAMMQTAFRAIATELSNLRLSR